MISFETLDELMFGAEGFDKNKISLVVENHWESKLETWLSTAYEGRKWEIEFEENLFSGFAKGTELSFLLNILPDTDIKKILELGRTNFYLRQVCFVLASILNQTSLYVRQNDFAAIEVIMLKVRWYIFESNKLNHKYKIPFEKVIDSPGESLEDDMILASNYLINTQFRDGLIKLYYQISSISSRVSQELNNDNFIRETIYDKSAPFFSYGIFRGKLNQIIEDDTINKKLLPHRLKIFVDALKSILENAHVSRNEILFEQILSDIEAIEDLLFMNHAVGFLVSPELIENLKTCEYEDLFEVIYSMIKADISQYLLPNDRMYQIQSRILNIDAVLGNKLDEFKEILRPSLLRKLGKRLQLDFETIKANPEIDLKEFDRNRLKPIKTTISVAKLAKLFRVLVDDEIITPEEKSEFHNTLSKVFVTKATSEISANSFKNNFNDPEQAASLYWKDKFLQYAKKL